jgi:hypothetical protein
MRAGHRQPEGLRVRQRLLQAGSPERLRLPLMAA